MSDDSKFRRHEDDDYTCLWDNYHYLAERGCIEKYLYHAPIALRRSTSLEDSSTGLDVSLLQKPKDKSLSSSLLSGNLDLSSPLNLLCLKLRQHQLLSEDNRDIAKSSEENELNWCKTAAHLRPILEKITMMDYKTADYFLEVSKNDEKTTFKNCKRQDRRNAVCLEIDRLYYNGQLFLFATLANEVQIEFTLSSRRFNE